jgi:small subunit ribosomal protein S2
LVDESIAGFARVRPAPAASEGSEWGIPPAESKVVQQYMVRQYQSKHSSAIQLCTLSEVKKLVGTQTGHLGSKPGHRHLPPHILLNPPSPSDVTLELLLACGAHLGHKSSLWNPGNSQYIFGTRDGIHILSLEAIAAHLRRAARVVEGVALRGGLILFAGTRKKMTDTVVKAAEMVGGCHVFRKWQPGTLTNGEHLLYRSKAKVVNEKDEDVPGFEEQLRKRAIIKPDLVICLNPRENQVLLRECGIHNIPTIGIIDTNTDPTTVTYPIPANDDSLRCVQTIAMVLARAGQAGNAVRLKLGNEGVVTYRAPDGLRPLYKPETSGASSRTRSGSA